MSREDRKKLTESIAEKFIQLDENGKSFMAGYITAKCEQHQHQEGRLDQKIPVA